MRGRVQTSELQNMQRVQRNAETRRKCGFLCSGKRMSGEPAGLSSSGSTSNQSRAGRTAGGWTAISGDGGRFWLMIQLGGGWCCSLRRRVWPTPEMRQDLADNRRRLRSPDKERRSSPSNLHLIWTFRRWRPAGRSYSGCPQCIVSSVGSIFSVLSSAARLFETPPHPHLWFP